MNDDREKRIEDLLRQPEHSEAPPELLDRIREDIPDEIGEAAPDSGWGQGWFVAAALFVVVGGAWLTSTILQSPVFTPDLGDPVLSESAAPEPRLEDRAEETPRQEIRRADRARDVVEREGSLESQTTVEKSENLAEPSPGKRGSVADSDVAKKEYVSETEAATSAPLPPPSPQARVAAPPAPPMGESVAEMSEEMAEPKMPEEAVTYEQLIEPSALESIYSRIETGTFPRDVSRKAVIEEGLKRVLPPHSLDSEVLLAAHLPTRSGRRVMVTIRSEVIDPDMGVSEPAHLTVDGSRYLMQITEAPEQKVSADAALMAAPSRRAEPEEEVLLALLVGWADFLAGDELSIDRDFLEEEGRKLLTSPDPDLVRLGEAVVRSLQLFDERG